MILLCFLHEYKTLKFPKNWIGKEIFDLMIDHIEVRRRFNKNNHKLKILNRNQLVKALSKAVHLSYNVPMKKANQKCCKVYNEEFDKYLQHPIFKDSINDKKLWLIQKSQIVTRMMTAGIQNTTDRQNVKERRTLKPVTLDLIE